MKKLFIATLDISGIRYGSKKFETNQHILIDTSYKNIVDKIDRYTDEELDTETKEKIMSDLNICRQSNWISNECMQSFVIKIHDECEL